jgi:hypothetical protein
VKEMAMPDDPMDEVKGEIGQLRAQGTPVSLRTFDDLGGYDETLPVDGDRTVLVLTIGLRGELRNMQAHEAAKAWQALLARYPKAIIMLSVAGYDDDRREIWEIPEARDYVCRWAKLAGLDHSAAAMTSPLDRDAVGLLAKCGAFSDVDPDAVKTESKH